MTVRVGLLVRFGKLMRAKRLAIDLRQDELAEAIGVSQASYSAYERGGAFPTLPNLLLLMRELGITTTDLLALLEDPNGDEVAA